MSTRNRSRGRKRRMSRNRRRAIRKRRITIAAMLLILALLIWGGVYLYAKSYVDKQAKDVIYNHIYIDGTDVSGMTADEAKEALSAKVAEQGAKKLTLKLEKEKMKVTLSELGLSMPDMEDVVKQAVSYGKTGSVFGRYKKIKKLKKENVELAVSYAIDEEQAKAVLEERMKKVNKGTLDATIKRRNGQFIITDEATGITVDMEASQKILEEYFTGEWQNKATVIELVAVADEPKVTRAQLEKIQDVLGKYTTTCGYGGGRVQNIQTGAGKIDGTLLMPGEEFSADAAMRPYTAENGYAEAGSYENGKVVQSMGGGICQVSSTLYNAVLLSELEVTQRQPHSMLVSYVEPSMDAAIAGDYKDLKFKNNLEDPIYIEGYVSGGNISFVIYGNDTRSANRTVKYKSETLETKDPDPKFQAASDAAIGSLKMLDSAHVGKTAKLWKIVYENGERVSKEVINNSRYSSSPAVYAVGTKSDNAEAVKLVKTAIKTQDEKKIKAAISEAKTLIKAQKSQTGGSRPEDAQQSGTAEE